MAKSKKRFPSLLASLLIGAQLLAPIAVNAQEVELLEEKPEVAAVEINNSPNRMMTSINGDPATEMAFNWYMNDLFEDAVVRVSTSEDMSDAVEFTAEATEVTNYYLERDENGYIIFEDPVYNEEGELQTDDSGNPQLNGYYTDESVSGPEWTSGSAVGQANLREANEHVYKAKATELEPNTTYYYQVGSPSDEMSETGSFKTAGTEDDSFTFIQYTDTQNAYWNEHVLNEATFGADTIARAVETVGADELDFIMHTGDFVETAEVEDEWIDLIEQSKDTFTNFTMASVAGNHDEYTLGRYGEYLPPITEKFNEHVNVAAENDAISGGSYYSFDYNNVHFVMLNSNDNKEDDEDNPESKAFGKEQLEWAKADIQEARDNGAEWVVLGYHKPIFSKSYHSLQDSDVQAVREEFMQMIDEMDVDLALQGHDHVLSATYPLNFVPTEENFSNGVVAEGEVIEQDGVETYVNPTGTVFVLPNTAGTKAYDDIYSKDLEHLHAVRPRLDWMTQEDVDYYNSLFAFGGQPQESEAFNDSHSNWRDSTVQNFAVYNVDNDTFNVKIYQVSGDLLAGEERAVELVHEFSITKDSQEADATAEESDSSATSEEATSESSSEETESASTEEVSETESAEESSASEESSSN
ncbi:metallophosphoesterase family protein [Aerococcaceae bacterium DSM 111020]|nr:metallophosphoesterase family protein [Aerococcaceae bacterium DSM 111020]